ncbi:MAG TPA: hypothetical protein VMG35_16570 [Bryobacteraceae bacterium]|nr:hypothetical protein [Bryobacteraceae bacterium]
MHGGRCHGLDFLPGWEGSPLVDDLAREFDLTVAMENEPTQPVRAGLNAAR